MYNNSFSLENRKENAVFASVHFIRFENVIKNLIQIFGNQLWTVALTDSSFSSKCINVINIHTQKEYVQLERKAFILIIANFVSKFGK